MEEFAVKFRYIFIPFVIIAIATIGVYTMLNWLLFIKTTAFNVDEDVINIIGPMVFTWIPILIWLRPRVKLLRLTERRNKRPLTGYLMVAWAVIASTLAMSQQYLVTATGKLTVVGHINQIDSLPKTKYYTVKHFYIDKKLVRVKPEFNVTEKGRSYDMYIYAPCPIFDVNLNVDSNELISLTQDRDTITYARPAAWLAVSYSKTIPNRLSYQEKENEYKQFAKDCELSFRNQDLNSFVYLNRISRTRDFKGCRDAILSRDSSGQPPITILSPVNQAYELKNGNKLSLMFGSFGIGGAFFLITLLFSPLKNNYQET